MFLKRLNSSAINRVEASSSNATQSSSSSYGTQNYLDKNWNFSQRTIRWGWQRLPPSSFFFFFILFSLILEHYFMHCIFLKEKAKCVKKILRSEFSCLLGTLWKTLAHTGHMSSLVVPSRSENWSITVKNPHQLWSLNVQILLQAPYNK